MSEEKRVIFDLKEMGERYGLESADVIKDGKVIMRDHVWTQAALQRAVAEVQESAQGADIVELRGHLANWALSAMAWAALPAKSYFEIGPGGMYHLTSLPFPVTEEAPTCGMFFEVKEEGDRVYVRAMTDNPDADAHGFDLTKFDQIVMPPIPAGKDVFLSGETVNPVAVSMALTYADTARSVFQRFHQEPAYHCSITHTPDFAVGDTVAAE